MRSLNQDMRGNPQGLLRTPPNAGRSKGEEIGAEELVETVPLDFTEDDVSWVASKLSGAAGALGAEAIDLHNWLLCFGCASEELRVVVASLAD